MGQTQYRSTHGGPVSIGYMQVQKSVVAFPKNKNYMFYIFVNYTLIPTISVYMA